MILLKRTLFATLATMVLLFVTTAVGAEKPGASGPNQGKRLAKVSGTDVFNWGQLNINNITTWMRYDGDGNQSPGGNDGVIYPIGTGNVVYEDGLVFAGKVFTDLAHTTPGTQAIHVGGSTYLSNTGTRGGAVTGSGASAVAANPADPSVRVYRIRRDYYTMTDAEAAHDAYLFFELNSVAEVTPSQIATIRQQYDNDWTNWPTQWGAPYIDRNHNGVYDPPPAFSPTFGPDDLINGNYDEPGVAGADLTTPADQLMFTVYNDLDRSQSIKFEGSEPTGLEVQKTVWAYKRSDALGNVYFTRYRIIDKGGVTTVGTTKGAYYLDSMYVCQWSDIDLGNAGDDLAGCDSTRSLGFVYNGQAHDNTFDKFGLPPPASGYHFLAGPLVNSPGDSAVYKLGRIHGKKNLPMSSFAYFSAGSPYSDPPFNNYVTGTGQWWNMLRGYAPIGDINTPPVHYDFPPGLAQGPFPLSGNPSLPASVSNFIDGQGTSYSFVPGDRRILLNTGPFQMAPGDTQEVYVGYVCGLGADRLSSVGVLKANDNAVKSTFDLLFQVAKPPASPKVTVATMNEQIILDWGEDVNATKATENKIIQPGNYAFQGYNLYQFPSASSSLADGKRIGTFDIVDNIKVITDNQFVASVGKFLDVPIQFGSDAGVVHSFVFKRDYIKDIDKIYNGQEYYLAVTAYSYTSVSGYTAALESSPQILTCVAKNPFGTTVSNASGDTVKTLVRTAGVSDGTVIPIVINPMAVTGHNYQVNFDTTGGINTWRVTDLTTNTVKVSGLTNQSGDNNYPFVDGIMVKVFGAPNDVKDFWHVANPSGPLAKPTYAAFAFNGSGFPTTLVGPTGPNNPGTTVDRPEDDWGGGKWGVHTGGNNADATYTGRFLPRVFRNDNFSRFVPYDFEMRFTAAGGKAWLAFSSGAVINVPFELWNIGSGTPNDPSDDHRMIPWINDEDASGSYHLMQIDHTISGGDNDPYTSWVYWHEASPKTPGHAGYDAFVAAGAGYTGAEGTGGEVMARTVLVNWNGGSVSAVNWPANVNALMPATGNTIRIISTKPNTPTVVFQYSTTGNVQNAALAKASSQRVGVFPNPYYAFNNAEQSKYNKFITFNNLPAKATIRIFNVGGQLVRTLTKNSPDQYVRWNLTNESNYPVASGMYIAYVDMPDISATKIVKFAVIQEQEILDIY